MANAVLNVKLADMEPFKRFISKVTQAAENFGVLTDSEIAALPPAAAVGITQLRAAVTEICGD